MKLFSHKNSENLYLHSENNSATLSESDSPRFQAEVNHSFMQRETKIKLILVLFSIILLVLALMYLKNYFSTKFQNNLQNNLHSDAEDWMMQRKVKTFESPALPRPTTSDTYASIPIKLPHLSSLPNESSSSTATNNILNFATPSAAQLSLLTSSSASPASKVSFNSMMLELEPISTKNQGSFASPNPPHLSSPTSNIERLFSTPVPDNKSPLASDSPPHNIQALKAVQEQALVTRQRSGAHLTATAQISAASLGQRSFVLTKGSFIPCVLETQLVSNVFGMTSCVISHHVYSDDGKIILLEKGSKATGNYGSNLRNGDTRLAVVWDRIKSPHGVIIDINSPASDHLGAMGLSGVVDKHWFERIGGAVLLSLLQDSVQYASSSLAYHNYMKEQKNWAETQNQLRNNSEQTSTTTTITDPKTGLSTTVTKQSSTGPAQGASDKASQQLVNPPVFGAQNINKQGSAIAEQVLSASINAAPTLYKNRGELVYIFVANDLWFDSVYELKP